MRLMSVIKVFSATGLVMGLSVMSSQVTEACGLPTIPPPCQAWDKIHFTSNNKDFIENCLGIKFPPPGGPVHADIKVPDDPTKVKDLEGDVISFVSQACGVELKRNGSDIKIQDVDLAIFCPPK